MERDKKIKKKRLKIEQKYSQIKKERKIESDRVHT
jgi:hypothetical protein